LALALAAPHLSILGKDGGGGGQRDFQHDNGETKHFDLFLGLYQSFFSFISQLFFSRIIKGSRLVLFLGRCL
jgi:hypothetical protein